MGFELTAQFKNHNWLKEHIDSIKNQIVKLPSFVADKGNNEFWLKDPQSKNSWDYDARIFIRENDIFLEMSVSTDAFFRDVRSLVTELSKNTEIVLIDDDGDEYSFE